MTEKLPIPLYKRKQMAAASAAQDSEVVDFAGITTQSLAEKSSLIKVDQRSKSGMNMALLKGLEQRRGFDPLSSKCGICKQSAV